MGCGRRFTKMVWQANSTDKYEGDIVRLDINPDVKPDVIWDLRKHPLPFSDNEFDEIHAYHILEHLAQQGDYEFFFAEFNEYYRILKPGGGFYGVVPKIDSKWAWGDPGHTRVFPKEYFIFLNKYYYDNQANDSAHSDYRYIYNSNFQTIFIDEKHDNAMAFILVAVK